AAVAGGAGEAAGGVWPADGAGLPEGAGAGAGVAGTGLAGAGLAGAGLAGAGVPAAGGAGACDCASTGAMPHETAATTTSARARRKRRRQFIFYTPWPCRRARFAWKRLQSV